MYMYISLCAWVLYMCLYVGECVCEYYMYMYVQNVW